MTIDWTGHRAIIINEAEQTLQNTSTTYTPSNDIIRTWIRFALTCKHLRLAQAAYSKSSNHGIVWC